MSGRAVDGSAAIGLVALALAACTGAPQDGAVSRWTDDELRAAAYGDYTGPADMYSDPYRPLYYVNTISTDQSESEWRELCTDDRAQASQWVDESDGVKPNVAEREDERFFEFARDRDTYRLHLRVHRCAYFDPYVYDFFDRGPERGVFNHRPLTAEAVADLGEYLWFLRYYNIAGYTVMASEAEEDESSIRHSLYYISLSYGDWGLCDQIALRLRTSTVDRETGAVIEENQLVRAVQGACR